MCKTRAYFPRVTTTSSSSSVSSSSRVATCISSVISSLTSFSAWYNSHVLSQATISKSGAHWSLINGQMRLTIVSLHGPPSLWAYHKNREGCSSSKTPFPLPCDWHEKRAGVEWIYFFPAAGGGGFQSEQTATTDIKDFSWDSVNSFTVLFLRQSHERVQPRCYKTLQRNALANTNS